MAETPGTASAKFFFDAYDEKPDLPFFPELSAQAAQTKSTQGNLAALPALFSLGSQVNDYNASELEQLLAGGIPGYDGISSKWSSSLADLLEGKLSDDVSESVMRSSAAKSLGSGTAGSGFARDLVARDLGLTSANLKDRGMQLAPGFMHSFASTAVPRPFDIAGGFVSPGAQLGLDQYNAEKQFENQWLRNKLAAKAEPWKVGLAEGTGALLDTAANVGLGMLGGGMGGGGSTPKYSPAVNAWDTPDYTPGAGGGYSRPWTGAGYGGGDHADWGYVPPLETLSYYGPYDPAW